MSLDAGLHSPKEYPLFVVGAFWSTLAWLALVFVPSGPVLAISSLAALLTAQALLLAHIKGNAVRLSPTQLPDLYARCRVAAERLGMPRMPEVYVMQSGGALNAFATKLLSRRFVVIYSELIHQCEDPRQLDFVLGHEMGHLAAGHLTWNLFLLPAMVTPWLGPALSRAREYTCDRCGLAVVGELEPALRGLVVLAAGGRLAAEVELAEFMHQRFDTGDFWMAARELCMSHPYLCKRVAALAMRHAPMPERNLVAWATAPLLGVFAEGSALVTLLVIYSVIAQITKAQGP